LHEVVSGVGFEGAQPMASKKGQVFVTGFEMAVGVLLGYFGGQWIGNKFGWQPWASLIGAALGFIAGAYLMIKESNRVDEDRRP
jgi:F0F1-type ATP synthase assembly protein I